MIFYPLFSIIKCNNIKRFKSVLVSDSLVIYFYVNMGKAYDYQILQYQNLPLKKKMNFCLTIYVVNVHHQILLLGNPSIHEITNHSCFKQHMFFASFSVTTALYEMQTDAELSSLSPSSCPSVNSNTLCLR